MAVFGRDIKYCEGKQDLIVMSFSHKKQWQCLVVIVSIVKVSSIQLLCPLDTTLMVDPSPPLVALGSGLNTRGHDMKGSWR